MPITSDALTHLGTVRTDNEDAILAYPDAGLWAVADGMGGHQAGDYASQCLIEHLHHAAEQYRGQDLVDNILPILTEAHQAIYQHSQQLEGQPIIGSTIVVLILEADNYHCFWSGDSRCYLSREEKFTPITYDHTEAHALLASGDSMRHFSHTEKVQAQNTLVHAMGIDAEAPHIDYVRGYIYEDDRFFLCSDGVNKIYSDSELRHRLQHDNIETINIDLIEQAPEGHIPDNLSSIIIHIG